MKKKIISLITLLVCASLVTACNEEQSSDTPNSNGTTDVSSAYNYDDISDTSLNPISSSEIDSSNQDEEETTNELDEMIAEFVADVDITVPSTGEYDVLDYGVFYYYAYEQYVVYGVMEDAQGIIADQYATLFTASTNLTCLNDEDYPVDDYGYYYADAAQNILINFSSEDGYFYLTIYRYDGLAGELDVSDVDTNWYVDYINFDGYELYESFPGSIIPTFLDIDTAIEVPNLTSNECLVGLMSAYTDEDGNEYPDTVYVIIEGDQMSACVDTLKQNGFTAELEEHEDVTIDWDTFELVEYTYFTGYAYDANGNIYITMELDESNNTVLSFYNFDDLFTKAKTANTDWTDEEKALMNSTLHQVLPFIQFGDNYVVYDASDDDWTLFVIQDSYVEDLTSDYIDILLGLGYFVDNTTYDDTYYCLDNGIVYIEIYIAYQGGNYLEVYYEASHLDPLTSLELNVSSLDIVSGASYQLEPVYNPSGAEHPLTWSSSDESIATVDANGLVTINSASTAGSSAVITATTLSGKSASCTFTVKGNEVTGIAFKQDNYNVLPGDEPYAVEYYLLPYGVTSNETVSYSINSDNLGISFTDGKLSALETAVVGNTAEITVTCGLFSDTATVTVVPANIKHTLNREFFGISNGNSTYATYTKTTTDGATYETQAAGKDGIQLRSKNSNSGLIGHFEGRTCKSITITFAASTKANSPRAVDIYASNSPFTIKDMYGSTVSKVGTIDFDENNLTKTYTFTEQYSYIGLRSQDGAVYMPSIEIVW